MSSWRVSSGQEMAFREAWSDLDRAFFALRHRPLSGTLLQHRTDPTLFISIGCWTTPDDIEAMRRDESAQDAFLRLIELCDEAEMNSFLEVASHEPVREEREVEARQGVILPELNIPGMTADDAAPPRRARRRATRRRVRKSSRDSGV